LEEKVTHTLEEVTGRIGEVEETVTSSNACSNIKHPAYDGKTS